MIGRDEVLLAIALHEMDFVALVRAARLTGLPREEVLRRAVGGYLASLQRQGLDLGIVLPGEPKPEPERAETGKDGRG